MLITAEVDCYSKNGNEIKNFDEFPDVTEQTCVEKSNNLQKGSNAGEVAATDTQPKIGNNVNTSCIEDDLGDEIRILFRNMEAEIEEKQDENTILTNAENLYHHRKIYFSRILKYLCCIAKAEK
ncbi:hypothetical protein WA026_014754 [Henosepilachna vigintioctopunctata]|uniref:Uncharacterized protein n=1 Tax=Henosepilachna vigintioctopunctata TaxID=420089 RepID=A0AAW1VEZ5_9CUCU